VALVSGKAFASGIRALTQAFVVLVLAALLSVRLTTNLLNLLLAGIIVVLGSAFFCCPSITVAGLVLKRDRMMGIGQAITMPLFFASNALHPVVLMPEWLQAINRVNPLAYEVDALRGLLIGTPAELGLDFIVLTLSMTVMICIASALLGRLAR
jgi:ABC-2 type transport system permease protein